MAVDDPKGNEFEELERNADCGRGPGLTLLVPDTGIIESSRDPIEVTFKAELGRLGMEEFAACRERAEGAFGSRVCIVGTDGEDEAR